MSDELEQYPHGTNTDSHFSKDDVDKDDADIPDEGVDRIIEVEKEDKPEITVEDFKDTDSPDDEIIGDGDNVFVDNDAKQ